MPEQVGMGRAVGFRAGLSALLAVVVAGCSANAPSNRIAAVTSMAPESWNASREARAGIDHQWIRRFGDSQLTALVEEAVANNYDLRVAAERVRRAESVARLAGAPGKPQVQGSLNGQKQKQRFVGLPFFEGISNTSENYGASVDINWEIDLWGRVRAGQSAAMADTQARVFDLKGARTSLAAQVAKAWFALGEANDQIVLAEGAVEIRSKTAEALRERFVAALAEDGGVASQVRLAQTDVATAEATLAFWQGERERALRQIELLLGRYPAGKRFTSRGLPDAPSQPPAGLPSELLKRRPDVLAAERRFAASGKRVEEARLAFYPSFGLTGSRGSVTDDLGQVLDSSFGIWSFGAGVVQPIFNGGQLREEQAIAESDERISLGELQQTVLQAFGEVEQALVAEEYFAKREKAVAESSKLANAAAESAVTDFADGAVDALTLLRALDRKIQTALTLSDIRRRRLENRVDLHLALGGDFKVRGK